MRLVRDGHVASIILERPPSNAIDDAWLDAFSDALEAIQGDRELKAVVVRSTQERFFCGGADVGMLEGSSAAASMDFVRRVQETFNRLEALPVLVIALIEGHATGGGYELALACDVRLAAAGRHRIGLPEARLGLLPAGGGTQRLLRLVGPGRALALMCTARIVDAAEAAQWGLVDRVVERAALDAELADLTDRLADVPREAVEAIKRCVRVAQDRGFADGLAAEAEEIGRLFESEETRRRLTAFLR